MAKILLLFALFPLSALAHFCRSSPFSSLEDVTQIPLTQYTQCLHAMAFAPSSYPHPQKPFQKLKGEDVFAINCYLGEEDTQKFERFLIIREGQLFQLKYPKYFYQASTGDRTELPRNVFHFKDAGQDYYLTVDIAGAPKIYDGDKLAQISRDTGDSLNQIQNVYIKKYENYLRNDKLLSALNLVPLADNSEGLYSCLDKKLRETVYDYLSGKFLKRVPRYNEMVEDHNKFDQLPEKDRLKYELPWASLKDSIVSDLTKSHPICSGLVEKQVLEEAFQRLWKDNQRLYEGIHQRFFPSNPPQKP